MVGAVWASDAEAMSDSRGINYGRYMERAMRGVMAEVLGQVAEDGLPANHHFYITFETTHPGVDIPDFLRERYPREMMIVLQEWFDDLAVMGDRFRVTLNFSNTPQTLVVPFAAVKTFIDPSVKFGLKFDDQDQNDDDGDADEGTSRPHGDAEVKAFGPGEREPAGTDGDGDDEPPEPRGPADVVSLDRFRKN